MRSTVGSRVTENGVKRRRGARIRALFTAIAQSPKSIISSNKSRALLLQAPKFTRARNHQ